MTQSSPRKAHQTRGKAEATLVLEQAILAIVADRAPINVRGVAYVLFARKLIPSMDKKHVARVSRIATAMREAGTLDWRKIVDGSRTVERANTWSDPDALLRAAVKQYRRNHWQDQGTIVEVWSEKSTIQGIVQPVLDDLGVDFRVMHGFGSFTSVMQAADDGHSIVRRGQKLVIVYIGDWDPSGMYMSEVDLPERLARYGGKWRLKRVAIVKRDHHLPYFDVRTKKGDDTKRGDPRYKWFVKNHGRRCWELDAMNQNVLRDRVRKEIERYIDPRLWKHGRQIETAEVQSMKHFHKEWRRACSGRSDEQI